MTENEPLTAAKVDWASLSGVIIDGCELKEVAEVRDNGARFRVKILGSGGRMATAYFLQLDPKEAEDQLDVWLTLREIQHPNLSRPLSTGHRDVNGVDSVYLISPDPDEALLGVIPERPLEWEEAASLLHSVEQGLAHLHSYGLIHGSVSPETVGAVGYSILLNTDEVRRVGTKPRVEWQKPRYLAPESAGVNTTTEADVWCLGETLFETLSQQRYGTPGADLEKGLPLGAVVKRCLDKNPATRCTLKEAPAYEDSPPPEPEPAPSPVPEVKAEPAPAPPAAPPAPTATPTPVVESKPATVVTPAKPPVVEPQRPPQGTVRGPGVERPRAPVVPHPLTPKPAPRRVTKEDMALVPVAKRQRKVQGKKQPVGARIRTLDEPTTHESVDEGSTSTAASVLAVPAKILGLGNQKKSKLVRGIVAAVSFITLLGLALYFIVLPKVQGPVEPPPNVEAAQTTPTADSVPTSAIASTSPTSDSQSVIPENQTARPPQKLELFYAVESTFASQDQAVSHLNSMVEKYPDVVFKLLSLPKDGQREARLMVIVGGQLTRGEGETLKKKLGQKGLTLRLEPID